MKYHVLKKNTRSILIVTLLSFCQAGLAEKTASGQYKIDQTHSSIQFTVSHLGVSELSGRFNKFSGDLKIDRTGKSAVNMVVKTSSVDTNHAARDKHLRSPDFLNAKQYPSMKFVSESVKFNKQGEPARLIGKLTLHGKTLPVEWAVSKVGAGKDPWGGYRAGYNAVATIKRSSYGMKYMLGGVGDKIKIMIKLEAIKK